MLRSRYIPVLLIEDGELTKTKQFEDGIYVGDPINAIRIFNEKQVDELCLFDISVTKNGSQIDFELLKDIAVNANMPLTYGGGIKSVADASRIISLGFEKVSMSAAFFDRPTLVNDITTEVGAQSVAVCMDVRKINNEYSIFTHRGTKKTKWSLLQTLEFIEKNPIGEVIINSIDRDGTFAGYDMELAKIVRSNSSVNITILGGCRDLADISELETHIGVCGCAAGSYFTFVGKNNAVLLNYNKPNI
jgi:imidazole glycerol-phosphate synthase subunit HisF